MDFLDYSQGFFGPQYTPCPQASSSVVVLPFGLELAVSWETGTSKAPEAILRASHEVECFDESFGVAPLDDVHVRTLAAFPIPNNMEEALSLLSQKVANILDNKLGFPIILGGEHTLTAGAIRPFVERYDHLVLLHVDAHADLRDSYFGDPWSHACAIRRCMDYPSVSLISFGIRNMDRHEFSFWKQNPERVRLHLASEHAQVKLDEVREFLLGKNVYITIDVDGFDSSLMPATGTPEPGGLFWQDVIPLIRLATEVGNVVGMDVVELAPRPSLHGCNFLCAKLLFKTISFLKHYNKI